MTGAGLAPGSRHLPSVDPRRLRYEAVDVPARSGLAGRVRDMTPGAEVVIANWGLEAVDR